MARKNLLKGLMEAPVSEAEPARVDVKRPRYSTGAIGAVSQSIADLKSRSVTELDARMIDDAGLHDRFDGDPADHSALMASLQEYGQQVPVLVRPNPNDPERYQIVYGRRRVAALRELGQPVKALIRVLDDRELVIAQGQENAARKDLSFIEKANFARQMRDEGYARKVICDALHMDKTLISRMLSVADRIPMPVIEAIGSAPGIGRDRWLALADRIDGRDVSSLAVGSGSDDRFEAVFAALTQGKAAKSAPPAPRILSRADGTEFASISWRGSKLVVSIQSGTADGFDTWLEQNIEEIHRTWSQTGGE
ncbi:MAG: plasmid partitioning protein RepB [Pseudomonadota bacterium]